MSDTNFVQLDLRLKPFGVQEVMPIPFFSILELYKHNLRSLGQRFHALTNGLS